MRIIGGEGESVLYPDNPSDQPDQTDQPKPTKPTKQAAGCVDGTLLDDHGGSLDNRLIAKFPAWARGLRRT